VCAGPLELGTDVLDPDPDEVRHPIAVCWRLTPAFSDDHCSVCTDAHLRPVAFTYPCALNEAERCAQPRHRGPHIRI
jgi:hypothetical protein